MKGDWNAFDRPRTWVDVTRQQAAGNRALLHVLMRAGCVDYRAIRDAVRLKNALVEDLGEQRPTPAHLEDMAEQFTALLDRHDTAAAVQEREDARRAFCIRQGIDYRPIDEYEAAA